MNIYPVSLLLELAHSPDIQPYACLEPFYRSYSKLIKEDKSAPLFSKTSKYSSFPVRCQWKKESKKNKKEEVKKVEEPSVDWRKEEMVPTKVQKVDGLRGNLIRILNKITPDSITTHTQELLRVLTETQESDRVRIVAELILEKVWYDKSFYTLYVSLCQKLWQSTEWMASSYTLLPKDSSFFYSTIFTSTLHGPFSTQAEAIQSAEKNTNLRRVFLALCRDNFFQRETWIRESQTLLNDTGNKKYRLRRKLFGTVEIMGQFFSMKLLSENVIHTLLSSLLHHGQGAVYEEEIEAFQLLWMIAVEHLSEKSKEWYKPLLVKEYSQEWSPRIRFMIQDILETISSYRPLPKKNIPQEEEDPLKLSRTLEGNRKHIKELVRSEEDFLSSLVRDAMEYPEYLSAHLQTLFFFQPSSSALSILLSRAGEDWADLLVDAPKAPQTMTSILNELLKQYESIDISYSSHDEKVWSSLVQKLADPTKIHLVVKE